MLLLTDPLTNGMLAKDSTKRLTAHTDESLMTLLFTSPGTVCAACVSHVTGLLGTVDRYT